MLKISEIIDKLDEKQVLHLLGCGRRGIEKEGLRYDQDDILSTSMHPKALGSTLTHAEITTDYAESLLELVTPDFRHSRDTLSHLHYLHRVIANYSDDYILNASMPAHIEEPSSVEIGYYGESHAGQMRRLYRKGLALRYGKAMQLISGIHFNYSICNDLFRHYASVLDANFDQHFIDECYINLVRNIRIYAWVIPYLFGCSPALDRSFFRGQNQDQLNLLSFDADTLYRPYATSLRMSDIGYQNKTSHLVSANTLSQYIFDLKKAVQTPSSIYESYGLKDKNGAYQQISTDILQIENEYYTVARPKQIVKRGETPLNALYERGVRYVELRSLDINCFECCGVSQEQLDFLELYMLYCLFEKAPSLDEKAEDDAKFNMSKTSSDGRDPQLKLRHQGQTISIRDWGTNVLFAMRPLAEAMDKEKRRPHYVSLLEKYIALFEDPDKTPSAQILREMTSNQLTYHQYITQKSRNFYQAIKAQGMTKSERAKVEQDALNSILLEQELVKKSQTTTFEAYLSEYFKQLDNLV